MSEKEKLINIIKNINGRFTMGDIYNLTKNRKLANEIIDELGENGLLEYYEEGSNTIFEIKRPQYYISIPVPLGTTLYTYDLKCCDACYFQGKLFEEKFPKNDGEHRCGVLPCHTRYIRTREIIFTLENVSFVLKYYNKSLFDTPEKAETAGKKLAEDNRITLEKLGFTFDEKGYSTKNEEDY